MAKVLVAQPIAEEGLRVLTDAGHEAVRPADASVASLRTAAADVDAILVRNARLPREVIEAAPRLKVISRHGAGLETIDIAAATERGVRVTYAPVANSLSVAEHVMAMVLALAKNLRTLDAATRTGGFEMRHTCLGIELAGRTLGIVGLGNVGRRLATMASAGFEMRVLACDPAVAADDCPAGPALVDLQRLLGESDFVSLNLPLNDETRGLIGRAELAAMKPTAYLVNCARAGVVDEPALLAALRDQRIAGVAIDVYESDPPPNDHPLFALEDVLLTPHSAAHTREAMARMAVHAAQGIVEVLAGREPTWPAN